MRISKRTGSILVVLVLALVLLRQQYHKLLIGSCNKITIAKAVSTSGGGGNAGLSLNYKFSYNEKIYEGSTLLDKVDFYREGESYFLNRLYFVKFYCSDPSISELDLAKTVPDTIVKIPPNGWDKLPVDE